MNQNYRERLSKQIIEQQRRPEKGRLQAIWSTLKEEMREKFESVDPDATFVGDVAEVNSFFTKEMKPEYTGTIVEAVQLENKFIKFGQTTNVRGWQNPLLEEKMIGLSVYTPDMNLPGSSNTRGINITLIFDNGNITGRVAEGETPSEKMNILVEQLKGQRDCQVMLAKMDMFQVSRH